MSSWCRDRNQRNCKYPAKMYVQGSNVLSTGTFRMPDAAPAKALSVEPPPKSCATPPACTAMGVFGGG